MEQYLNEVPAGQRYVLLETGLQALLVVSVVSAAAPFVCALLARFRVPQIVVLIIGGLLIGPEGFGLAEPQVLDLVANIGLGLVFLLAGYELEPTSSASGPGGWPSLAGWSARRSRRGGRPAGGRRSRARVRSGRVGSDHDGAGDAAADPA